MTDIVPHTIEQQHKNEEVSASHAYASTNASAAAPAASLPPSHLSPLRRRSPLRAEAARRRRAALILASNHALTSNPLMKPNVRPVFDNRCTPVIPLTQSKWQERSRRKDRGGERLQPLELKKNQNGRHEEDGAASSLWDEIRTAREEDGESGDDNEEGNNSSSSSQKLLKPAAEEKQETDQQHHEHGSISRVLRLSVAQHYNASQHQQQQQLTRSTSSAHLRKEKHSSFLRAHSNRLTRSCAVLPGLEKRASSGKSGKNDGGTNTPNPLRVQSLMAPESTTKEAAQQTNIEKTPSSNEHSHTFLTDDGSHSYRMSARQEKRDGGEEETKTNDESQQNGDVTKRTKEERESTSLVLVSSPSSSVSHTASSTSLIATTASSSSSSNPQSQHQPKRRLAPLSPRSKDRLATTPHSSTLVNDVLPLIQASAQGGSHPSLQEYDNASRLLSSHPHPSRALASVILPRPREFDIVAGLLSRGASEIYSTSQNELNKLKQKRERRRKRDHLLAMKISEERLAQAQQRRIVWEQLDLEKETKVRAKKSTASLNRSAIVQQEQQNMKASLDEMKKRREEKEKREEKKRQQKVQEKLKKDLEKIAQEFLREDDVEEEVAQNGATGSEVAGTAAATLTVPADSASSASATAATAASSSTATVSSPTITSTSSLLSSSLLTPLRVSLSSTTWLIHFFLSCKETLGLTSTADEVCQVIGSMRRRGAVKDLEDVNQLATAFREEILRTALEKREMLIKQREEREIEIRAMKSRSGNGSHIRTSSTSSLHGGSRAASPGPTASGSGQSSRPTTSSGVSTGATANGMAASTTSEKKLKKSRIASHVRTASSTLAAAPVATSNPVSTEVKPVSAVTSATTSSDVGQQAEKKSEAAHTTPAAAASSTAQPQVVEAKSGTVSSPEQEAKQSTPLAAAGSSTSSSTLAAVSQPTAATVAAPAALQPKSK